MTNRMIVPLGSPPAVNLAIPGYESVAQFNQANIDRGTGVVDIAEFDFGLGFLPSGVTCGGSTFDPTTSSVCGNHIFRPSQGYMEAFWVAGRTDILQSTAGPITTIVFEVPHKLITGNTIRIRFHIGITPSLNGVHSVTVINSTTITIPVATTGGPGSDGNIQNDSYSPLHLDLGGSFLDVYTAVRFKQTKNIGNTGSNMKFMRQIGPFHAGNHGLFMHSAGDDFGYYFDDNVASGSVFVWAGMSDLGLGPNLPPEYQGIGELLGFAGDGLIHELEWHWKQVAGVGQECRWWIDGVPFTPPDSTTTQHPGDAAWSHTGYWANAANSNPLAIWSRQGLQPEDPSILFNSNPANTSQSYNFLGLAETWSGEPYNTSGSLFIYKAAMSTQRIGFGF